MASQFGKEKVEMEPCRDMISGAFVQGSQPALYRDSNFCSGIKMCMLLEKFELIAQGAGTK